MLIIAPALLSVAFLTLLERKILGIVGIRLGPFKVSYLGIFQPVTDAIKLANKSVNILVNFSFFFYYLCSVFIILMTFFLFFCLCTVPSPISFKYSILFFFLVLGFNSLNSIILGWRSFSKFSLIGSIRTVSQLISYEGVLYFCLFFFIILICRFDLSNFNFEGIYFLGFLILPCFYIWFPTFLAELNRTPYDFSEGESELVRGYNTEFGSSCFTLIFLGEYGNIVFFCLFSSFIFFCSSFIYFFIFLFIVIWFRSVLPRFRFDKLIILAWKFFIPFLTFFYLLFFFFFFC